MDLHLDLDLRSHRRFLVAGGTGFIGRTLCRELLRGGHSVTIISRNPLAAAVSFHGKARVVSSAVELVPEEIFDVVINLAGAPVVGWPWTEARRKILVESRLQATQGLMDFARRAHIRPGVWIQASATGFYGTDSSQVLDESSPNGTGFAAELCRRWEEPTVELKNLSIRCTILRFGLVFGRSGGALPPLMLAFRMGIGSVMGSGTQHLNWIHIEDLLRIIARVVRDDSVSGVINAVAPESPTYGDFARTAGRVLQRPVLLSVPDRVLRKMLGEMAGIFLDGPKIEPRRLVSMGFKYRFPFISTALIDLS
jgi:uncharacterized protein (TIGR01777 family)